MRADTVQLHWIWREFSQKLDSFSRRVQEGKDVASALEFAKFVKWCGLVKLLEGNPQPRPLTVDASHLNWKCDEIIRACHERYRRNDTEPHLEGKEVQSLHEKLDLMAGYLSRLCASPALTVNPIERALCDSAAVGQAEFDKMVVESRNPELTTMEGGSDEGESRVEFDAAVG